MTYKFTIEVDEKGGLKAHANKPMNFEDFMTMFCTLTLRTMEDMVDKVPEEHKPGMRGFLYDSFNVAVSKVLAKFAPDLELRPNLTTKAILEAEDKIILEGRLNEVEPGT